MLGHLRCSHKAVVNFLPSFAGPSVFRQNFSFDQLYLVTRQNFPCRRPGIALTFTSPDMEAWLGMAWNGLEAISWFYAQVLSFWLMGALIMDASQRYSGFSLVFSCMFSMMYCTFCCFTSWHVRAGHACCSPRTQESDCLHAMERCRCELIS